MRGPRIGRTILQYSDAMWNIKFGRQISQLSQRICKRPALALQLSINLNSPALGLKIQSLGGIEGLVGSIGELELVECEDEEGR